MPRRKMRVGRQRAIMEAGAAALLSLLTGASIHACGGRVGLEEPTLFTTSAAGTSNPPVLSPSVPSGGSPAQTGGAPAAGGSTSVHHSCEDRLARCPSGTRCVSGMCVLDPTCGSTPNNMIAMGNQPVSVVVGDWNGDGFADVAAANQLDSTVSVSLGCGNGAFASRIDYATGKGPYALVTCDLNGDRLGDLVSANGDDKTLTQLLNRGDGTFVTRTSTQGLSGRGPQALACADLNRDGVADVVLLGQSEHTVGVLLGTGDGNLGPNVSYPTGRSPYALAIADLNLDGNADVVVGNGFSSSSVSVLLGTGDGTLASPLESLGPTDGAQAIGLADLNGDGLPDLGLGDQEDRGPRAHFGFMPGKGDGSFGPLIEDARPASVSRVVVGDFNQDGRFDLLGLATGKTAVVFGQPAIGQVQGKKSPVADSSNSLVAADVNTDGKLDLLQAGGGHEVKLMLGLGDGTFR